jgi:predicted secreted protein
MKTRYIVLIVVGGLLAIIAVFFTGPIIRGIRYGTLFPVQANKDAHHDVSLHTGEKFTIVVRDNASIGDNWWLKDRPAYAMAGLDRDEYVSDSSSDSLGAGGRRYYTFIAKTTGTAQITLVNIFQGGRETHTVTIQLTIT